MKTSILILLAVLATVAPAMAQGVPAPRGGPWQMISAGTSGDGMPGVFLLNTETGVLMFCLVARDSRGNLTGCGVVPHSPGS